MSEDTIRLATIGRILRRRWRLLTLCTLAGAAVGLGASLLFPPSWTTSASVLMAGQWEERELLTQVEVATSSAVIDRSAAALKWPGVDGTELQTKVAAKAADGNIIKITGTADTPEKAQRLSDQVAQQFVGFASRIGSDDTAPDDAEAGPEALRKQVAQTNRRISELAEAADPGQTVESVQARTELEKLRTALQDAMEKLEEADPAIGAKNSMVVMGPAAKPTSEAPPTRMQLVAGGALIFLLVAVIAHLTAARMNRRLRSEAEIAAALGSVAIGTVDVPGDRSAEPAKASGARARARRFLGVDAPWDTPAPHTSGDETSRRVRYRRVCMRLRHQLPVPRRLLIVVPEGDDVARRAAGQLVTEAKNDPLLRVVEVSVAHPMVPDREAESGVLVVLGAGAWTAEELGGIASACADGGHEVVGVVVAGAVRARPSRSADQPPESATLALAVRGHATGGPV
ncbi:Wzz/FepE/Etk N-terminal domain-containing protein [Streptomyces sp. NPDC016845]|uniref:Wzz/FepE/Etk N-terminal domain-containing protein n=1 Tax=Streptomyces sp. NPDC016845 TaxID=3364972 RepID=UPI003792F3D7